MTPEKGQRAHTRVLFASAIVVAVMAGALATVALSSVSPVLRTTTITTRVAVTASGAPGPVTYTKFVSLWQALKTAYGKDFTSVPQNVTVRLALYQFLTMGNQGGASVLADIPYDNVTGLPLQPVTEKYPDGVVVSETGAVVTPSCAMFMLIWDFNVPTPNIPHGGETSVSAINGTVVTSPRHVSLGGLGCPSSSTG